MTKFNGGASFCVVNKVDPEIVRAAGRRRSLAYEIFPRSYEQVISRHLADFPDVPVAGGVG